MPKGEEVDFSGVDVLVDQLKIGIAELVNAPETGAVRN